MRNYNYSCGLHLNHFLDKNKKSMVEKTSKYISYDCEFIRCKTKNHKTRLAKFRIIEVE